MGLKRYIFPNIVEEETAKKTARQGMWASLSIGVITGLAAFILKRYGALIDASLFLIIALGIYRMSRVAAYAGLFLYIVEVAFQFYFTKKIGNIGIISMAIVMFINGIRGTVAYHRFKRKSEEDIELNINGYQKELEEKMKNPFE